MAAFLFSFALELVLFVAFALLALTQFQHRRATGVPELRTRRRKAQIRGGAVVLLVLTLVIAVGNEGGGFGFLLWVGLVSFAACNVAFVLGWWPGILRPLAKLLSNPHSLFERTENQVSK
ncbi:MULTISPECIES: DUF3325 domain-containing protein [Acetobacter]|nr:MULTISPECIES: DUF3325 domain-containing protein [Acetobacter]